MTDADEPWQNLLERAAEYDVSTADVIEALDARRGERSHD